MQEKQEIYNYVMELTVRLKQNPSKNRVLHKFIHNLFIKVNKVIHIVSNKCGQKLRITGGKRRLKSE